MMGSYIWLAVEAGAHELVGSAAELAESAEAKGFGLNFDVLETNLINLAIILAGLVYFGRGFLGNILGKRRAEIETAIQEAEQRKQQSAKELASQQQKLAQAQAEAERIKAAAAENAKSASEAILAQAALDIERLKEAAERDTASDQERAIAELRQRVVALALEQVESRISSTLNSEDDQRKLVDRSIALLGDQS
ncbi:ATP synthase F0 sector subunit b [uncultured Synechococcales cyanobacterium]|uniref:ATP synthase subunit b n=1 Tax=uncultured Synechococcales cyanobacterium TaxID=1936017 RepID=A0A6J4VX72_9CYAN|nr:ATP synthase F0 sector subunit b [uncultured Synechococcales cyanobacterium]